MKTFNIRVVKTYEFTIDAENKYKALELVKEMNLVKEFPDEAKYNVNIEVDGKKTD
jgi:hypothetical protein